MPIVFQIGICDDCLTDCVMRRLSEVKNGRLAKLADDMQNAAGEIRAARRRAARETQAHLNSPFAGISGPADYFSPRERPRT